MKKCWLLAAGLAVRIGFGAVEVGGLPAWENADTEVSTNVPFAFPQAFAKHFLLALELAGTLSNNVQVAFGRDVNTNGVLEVEETGMALGWDCGVWKVRSGVRSVECGVPSGEWTAEAVTTDRVKVLEVDLKITRGKGKRIVGTENAVALDWGTDEKLPRAMYDNSWDMLRLTVRGVDRADESLRAAVRIAGMAVIIK